MSRHYFPSVLDNFEKQLITSEQNTISNTDNIESVTTTVQQLDPKYNY